MKRMKLSEKFEKAKALIERGWVQHTFAKNARGEFVDPCCQSACAWCATGAMCAVEDPPGFPMKMMDALCDSNRNIEFMEVGTWNDMEDTTKEDVLEAFDNAIAWCKRGEEFLA